MARKLGLYNMKMAVAILSGLNPQLAFHDIPQLPVVHGDHLHMSKRESLWPSCCLQWFIFHYQELNC